MIDVRSLLELLDRSTLARILRDRELPAAATTEERRARLVRSFRGDGRAVLESLDRSELLGLATCHWERGGRAWRLAAPSRRSTEQLIEALARVMWAERQPEGLVEVIEREEPEEDEESMEEEEGSSDDPEEEDEFNDAGEADDDEQIDDQEDDDQAGERTGSTAGSDPRAAFFASFGDDWSKALKVSRLIRRVHGESVLRLKTVRFQALVRDLRAAGLEAQLQDGTPVDDVTGSPGIDAKVRLRRSGAAVPPARPKLVIVNGPPQPSRPGRRSLPPYQLAHARLVFLTALPNSERRRDPRWPGAFLDASTSGLQLADPDLRHLRVVAEGFVVGTHPPSGAVSDLRDVLSPPEWEELFAAYLDLNDHWGDVAQRALALVREILSLPDRAGGSGGASAQAHVWPLSQAAAEPAAATAQPTNHRSLGALDDLFADLPTSQKSPTKTPQN